MPCGVSQKVGCLQPFWLRPIDQIQRSGVTISDVGETDGTAMQEACSRRRVCGRGRGATDRGRRGLVAVSEPGECGETRPGARSSPPRRRQGSEPTRSCVSFDARVDLNAAREKWGEYLKAEIQPVSAHQVTVTEETLTAELSDGRTISVPLVWYPRLVHATPEERSNWRLIGNGEGIHWPDLDEDISVENIILGKPSGESQQSLRRWLEERATDHIHRRS